MESSSVTQRWAQNRKCIFDWRSVSGGFDGVISGSRCRYWSQSISIRRYAIFRGNLQKKKRELSLRLLSLLSRSLELPADYFESRHFCGPHKSILRITRYPALKKCTEQRGRGVSRILPHQDIGSITILSQDMCGGLEVLDSRANGGEGQWIPVTPKEGTLVINIGNIMMRWTNYVYRSSVHRVVSTDTSDDEDRLSIIFFVNPIDSCLVQPVKGTVSEQNPSLYKPFTVGEYLTCKFTQLFDPDAKAHKGKCEFDD